MFSATHSLKGLSCLNSPGTPQRHSADLRRQPNFAEKSVIAAISCVEQRSFKIPQLPALREVVSESAQQKRRFFLLLFFVPRFTSRNMEIRPRKRAPSLWGKSRVILPFEEVSRSFATQPRQGPEIGFRWPRMLSAPFARHSGSQGQTGAELASAAVGRGKFNKVRHTGGYLYGTMFTSHSSA